MDGWIDDSLSCIHPCYFSNLIIKLRAQATKKMHLGGMHISGNQLLSTNP